MADGHRKRNPHKALMHQLRVELLLRIISAGATSPNELSNALDRNLNVIAYHVRILQDYDAIELVDTKKRRGATEHFYSAVPDSEVLTLLLGQWMSATAHSAPSEFLGALLKLKKGGEVPIATALPVSVDSEGAEEIREAVSQFMDTIRSVAENSKVRTRGAVTRTYFTVGILAFPLQANPSSQG